MKNGSLRPILHLNTKSDPVLLSINQKTDRTFSTTTYDKAPHDDVFVELRGFIWYCSTKGPVSFQEKRMMGTTILVGKTQGDSL